MSGTESVEEKPRTKTIVFVNEIVDAGGGKHTEIVLRPPTGGDVLKARREADGFGTILAMISLVTGKPRFVIEKMDIDQINEASAFIQGFTDSGLQTG